MKYKIFTIIIITFLLIMNISLANTDYNETGNFDNSFLLGRGIFTTDEVEVTTFSRSLTETKQTPIITDLDNDLINELIILDQDTFKIYNNKELVIQDTLDFGSEERYSNFITFDIDGDLEKEIIMAYEESDLIKIFNYTNSEGLTEQASFAVTGHNGGEMVIKCSAPNECLLARSDYINSGINNGRKVFVNPFNSTAVQSNLEIDAHNGFGSVNRNGGFCFAQIKTMGWGDCDDDGDNEYSFTYAEISESDGKQLVLKCVDVTSGTASVAQTATKASTTNFGTSGSFNCPDNFGKFFTSPLTFEFDSGRPGEESLVGLMNDADEFELIEFDASGNEEDKFPEIGQSDGIIISNVFKSNVKDDTGTVEACVFGYELTDQRLSMLCGSKSSGDAIEHDEYRYDETLSFNVTQDYLSWNVITHSTQHSNEQIDGNDPTEAINSYGIFTVNDDCSIITGVCSMDLAYTNPKGDSVVLSNDAGKTGSEDLIVMTDNGIFYLDDGLSNEPATITSIVTNPCITDSIVKQNTSVLVTVTVEDGNSDLVGKDQVRASLTPYYGSVHEHIEQNSTNTTSGAPIPFTFTANITGSSQVIRVTGEDVTGETASDIQDLTFTVGSQGLEFGDSECTFSFVTDAEETEEEFLETLSDTDADNNSFVNAAITIKELTGIGGTLFFLIFMIAFVWGVASSGSRNSFLIAMFGSVLLLVVGSLVGLISTGIIITLVVISIIIIGMWLRNKFAGTSTD